MRKLVLVYYVEIYTPSFSTFFLPSANITLPLKFISFNAINKSDGIHLMWKVIKDNAIKNFEIEYSNDGVDFSSVAFLKANDFVSQNND